MGREILFRGKRIDNGKLIEGNYYPKKTGHYEGKNFVEEMQHLIIVNMNGGGYQYAEVDPETICQYAGLHDNTKWEQLSENEQEKFLSEWNFEKNRRNIKEDWNGRKIFEGDIVSDGVGNLFKVIHNEVFQFHFMCIESKYHDLTGGIADLYTLHRNYKLEVIGNIFDNPELLKGA